MVRSKNKHIEETNETLGKVIVSNLISLLKIFLVCFLLVFSLTNYVVKPVRVHQGSMYPTVKEGTWAFSNAFAAHFLSIKRYDIVVAQDKEKSPYYIIKRVIALPGETISVKDDVVYINGKAIREPYLENANNAFAKECRSLSGVFTADFDEITLGEDEYFLMGDNRPYSQDSRVLGAFEKSSIKASGLFQIYSPK